MITGLKRVLNAAKRSLPRPRGANVATEAARLGPTGLRRARARGMVRGMSTPSTPTPPLNLVERLPKGPIDDDALLEIFLEWAIDRGLELYPAQEQAILEIFAGRHVVLNTPTGSGKSLVALAMHFRSFARGRRSVYTSPIKALVTEKFFDLCHQFGAAQVGMLTGDASINREAGILCCTAEVLAAMALSEGDGASVHDVVMDEFHYYGDKDRGMAWQIPLLTLTRTTFMLMSATLGDTDTLRADLQARTGREVALVRGVQRPVPLEFSYSEEVQQETLQWLIGHDRAPIYVVSFSQREAAELAQSLTSINLCSKEEKERIAAAMKGHRFDSPYGKDVAKYLRHGLGIHHAGVLPKYRLLVEKLAQQGLLKVISGTDTLGVGINVPIRTVFFTRLTKFDGRKVGRLTVRDFKQIAGRAGRKGYDDRGWVVCQAPEHIVENKKADRRAGDDPKKLKKIKKKSAPDGFVMYDEEFYRKLIESPSEPLESVFKVDHGMIINLLQRADTRPGGGYRVLIDLISRCHERAGRKSRLRAEAATLFKQLRSAGLVELVPREKNGRKTPGRDVRVSTDLQRDFSVYHSLSLFLIHAVGRLPLDPDLDYALKVCTLAESIVEDPVPILKRQRDKVVGDRLAELKAAGVEYDERMDIIEKLTWPMPDAETVFELFDGYARVRPWVRVDQLSPKSIARDMFERLSTFNQYIKHYGLERVEGVLLRHLNQVYKVLVQTVPADLKTDAVVDLIGWLRATLQRADASLLTAWRALKDGVELVPEFDEDDEAAEVRDIAADGRVFRAAVRAELHRLVQALAQLDYDEAVFSLRPIEGDEWTAERFVDALRPFYGEYDAIRFDHEARNARHTLIQELGPRRWKVRQVLVDPLDDNFWYLEGEIDLRGIRQPEGPLIALTELRC